MVSLNDDLIVGVIGGGQLGKLLIENGFKHSNASIMVYSPELPLCHHEKYQTWIQGDLDDREKLIEFGKECDVLTYEIETVNISALREIRDRYQTQVFPSPEVLEIIQNKARQKEFLKEIEIPIPKFLTYQNSSEMLTVDFDEVFDTGFLNDKIPYPETVINKMQEGGYDGYGVKSVGRSMAFQEHVVKDLFPENGIVEEYISIEKELSVIIARDTKGWMVVSPVVEMVMGKGYKLLYSITPARVNESVVEECHYLAKMIAEKIDLVGVMAIEMFLEKDTGRILVNEMAPRPHNSGHQTIEYCGKSQYDLLAMILNGERLSIYSEIDNSVLGLNNFCVLENIIGQETFPNPKLSCDNVMKEAQEMGISHNIKLYDYRKEWSRPGRKLGHLVTRVREDQLEQWINSIKMFQSSQIPRFQIENPQVAVIMGSLSDYNVVKPALEILKEFSVHHAVRIVSAHRDSQVMLEFGKSAHDNGFKVIICAAGGAAHLPGMIASASLCPVIGIPVKSSNSIDGWDSLLSIAQMPGGIPVATMGLDGSKNAALMAIRILAVSDSQLYLNLDNYQRQLKEKVQSQNMELRKMIFQCEGAE